MLFDFSFRSLENVQPWGEPQNLKISWFGLTEGFYRLKVGSSYLFNYSDQFKNYWSNKFPDTYSGSFVDYYLVRLWEDMLEILPDVLEPIPVELRNLLEMDYETWSSWYNKAIDWGEHQVESGLDEEDTVWNIVEIATSWRNKRWLDAAYLQNPPRIWIWSTDDKVVISWDNQGTAVEGILVWSATQGSYSMSRCQFLDEVRAFDNKLIFEMGQRIESICADWDRSEVFVDIPGLKHEHRERSEWLKNALQKPLSTEWDQILSAVRTVSLE